MIIVECAQGTPEWHAARAGVCTASNFRLARQRMPDGKLTKTADDYAFKLACERFIGDLIDDEVYETWAMRRGQKLEAEARARHMIEIGVRVRPVGIILTEDRAFGASADGWIGVDGGAEYKCLVSPGALKEIYLRNNWTFFEDQVMGNLWLSGRKWWDFCVYCPSMAPRGLEFYRQRRTRDENYIEHMVYELLDFNNTVGSYVEQLEDCAARRAGPIVGQAEAETAAQALAEASASRSAPPSPPFDLD